MQNFQILNGNELIIQGGLEAGFELYTGYPGSPLADFFNILHDRKNEFKEKGIHVVIANSEANAAAMASGAKMAGKDTLVGMKSMGLHVASDALSVGNFSMPIKINSEGEYPGTVVVVGDDPWSISTSTPADSRFLFKHLHMPFLEPSTPQELKDWMKHALTLSRKSSVYTGVLLTTFMAEGGGRVEVNPEKNIESNLVTLDPKEFDLSKNVLVPPNSLKADVSMINERFPKVLEELKKLNLDKEYSTDKSSIGIISSGAVFETLKQVLEESNMLDQFHLYKCAASFPLIEDNLIPYLEKIKKVIVVEEKRAFLEVELKELIQKNFLEIEVFGKEFVAQDKVIEGFPSHGGLNYEIIYQKLNLALDCIGFDKEAVNCSFDEQKISSQFKLDLKIPRRLPTFCPGCPHRETLSIMKDIRKTLADKDINLISHGDVGCYSLAFLEPFKEMHDLSAMGQGGSMAAGTDIFTTNPSIVLMGDSTFFHSGMSSISNSVQLGHNITYILLDNDNTAMTGHQMTPRTGVSVEGDNRPKQDIQSIVKAMKVDQITEVNPSDRYFYKNLLTEYVQNPGVKVIVSNKECGLTFHGRNKRADKKLFSENQTKSKEFYQINTMVCEDCRECIELTGCPGLTQTFDAYGTKVNIDPQICVADSYCTKIKACPSFELVEVSEYHPTMYQEFQMSDTVDLPAPKIKRDLSNIAAGVSFNAAIIGVGGSGVTTISRVLAEASKNMNGRDDLDFKFVDQKGLAQRNGSVTSHLTIYNNQKSHSQVTTLGSAELVMSPDLLEGARALKYLAKSGNLILDEDYQVPLSILLDRNIEEDTINESSLRTELKEKLGDQLIIAPMKRVCFNTFGRSVYSSAMLLGIAFQAGFLPFDDRAMLEAIKNAISESELDNNLKAFEIGRTWFLNPEKFDKYSIEQISIEDYIESVKQVVYPWQNKSRFTVLFKNYVRQFRDAFPLISAEHHMQFVHDLFIYDQAQNISKLIEDGIIAKGKYTEKEFPIAFRALVKTYWIKDEVFIAHQLSSYLKNKTDEKNYNKFGKSFKVKNINRPEFEFFGKKVAFDMNPTQWMLRSMAHLRMLRVFMPSWHKKEKVIAKSIRSAILNKIPTMEEHSRYQKLRELDAIKGYREVRFKRAEIYLRGLNDH